MTPPRLAIHDRAGGFSDRWLAYCREHGVPAVRVDCHQPDILELLKGCDALLWHWLHGIPEDVRCAPRVIPAAEKQGIRVFPSSETCWHYDDKVAQKYLLEAVGAPGIPTWVFYDSARALAWIESAEFPKVFKLSRGAGSQGVRLVRSAAEARRLVRRAFGSGFAAAPGILGDAPMKARNHLRRRDVGQVLRRLPQTLRAVWHRRRMSGREFGYVLFQEFLPGNAFDTRITVIGERAFGFRRFVRPGDFRASGSGMIDYDPGEIDARCTRIALDVSARIGAQSLAFDFISDTDAQPHIAEISYTYAPEAIHNCPGHWSADLEWRAGPVWPQDAILADLIAEFAGTTQPAESPA